MRGGCYLVVGLLLLSLAVVATAPPARADTNPPAGTIVYPHPGSWVNHADFMVAFSDPDGVSSASISVTLDGVPVSPSTYADAGWYNVRVYYYSSYVADGSHTAQASAEDLLGNGPTTLTWSFSVDTVPPVVNITYPVGNPVLTDGSLTVTWTGTDVGSGIDFYMLRLDDGLAFSVGTATSFPFHDLSPGVHYVQVEAFDKAGNYNYPPMGSLPTAVATVPQPPATPATNTTVQVTLSGPDQVPAWGIVLIVITTAEAVAVVALALRPRRGPPEGGKPAQ